MVDGKIIGPGELSAGQQELARKYIKISGAQGVMVGAMVTELSWDVRCLLLSNGVLRILRSVEAERSDVPQAATKLSELWNKLSLFPELIGNTEHGMKEGVFWTNRPFYKLTLADPDPSGKIFDISCEEFASRLVELVAAQISKGILHGNICRGNIAVEGDIPRILDFGFAGISERSANFEDFAPEIQQGGALSAKSEIYSLGWVLNLILKDSESKEYRAMLEGMMQPDPSARPDLKEILKFFLPEKAERIFQTISAPEAGLVRQAKAGKFLGTNLSLKSTEKSAGEVDETNVVDSRLLSPELQIDVCDTRGSQEAVEWAKETMVLGDSVTNAILSNLAEQYENTNEQKIKAPPKSVKRLKTKAKPSSSEYKAKLGDGFLGSKEAPVNINLERLSEKISQPKQPQKKKTNVRPQPFLRKSDFKASHLAWLIPILMLILIAGFQYVIRTKQEGKPVYSSESKRRYTSLWESDIPSRMKEVAQAAVFMNDEAAILTIIESTLADKKKPGVRNGLLKVAFNQSWEAQLSEKDRKFALTIGLFDLIGRDVRGQTPSLKTIHPGVLLALIGNQQMTGGQQSAVSKLPISTMFTLPGSYGYAFRALFEAGITGFDDPAAKALAHILCGNKSERVINTFLNSGSADEKQVIQKLRLLLLPEVVKFVPLKLVYNIFEESQSTSGVLINWMEEDPAGVWESVSLQVKLGIAAVQMPKSGLDPANLGDLLKAPLESLRKQAIISLVRGELRRREEQGTLVFLSDRSCKFTREQVVQLVATLTINRDQQIYLISKWLASDPDQSSLLKLLAVRAGIEPIDPVSIEVVRYLKKKPWKADTALFKQLLLHKEKLVRAITYTKLDPDNPEQQELLETMKVVDPDKRLRSELDYKIKADKAADEEEYFSLD